MSLTMGIGPLARPSAGQLNADLWSVAPAHALFLHPVNQRIRGLLDGQTVVDTTGAQMLHETGLLPRWYLPSADVTEGVLTPSDTTTHCPFKGDASYWHLTVGDRRVDDAAWSYPSPLDGCPDISALVSFDFGTLDTWLVEEEQAIGHPRDPFHRVDARRSSRHVVVRVAGDVVAETSAPVAVFETGLPVRWYVPAADVRTELLTPSDTTTVCPYKGVATYETVVIGGQRYEDVVWQYAEPLLEALPARGCRSFDGDGVEITAD